MAALSGHFRGAEQTAAAALTPRRCKNDPAEGRRRGDGAREHKSEGAGALEKGYKKKGWGAYFMDFRI